MRGKRILVFFVIVILLLAGMGYWVHSNKSFNPQPDMGPEGSLGVAFYATDTLPLSDDSERYLYRTLQRNAIDSPLELNFSIADPTSCYVGTNTHSLHDFFEVVVGHDGYLNIGYQY